MQKIINWHGSGVLHGQPCHEAHRYWLAGMPSLRAKQGAAFGALLDSLLC